jgi:hypothetical protein
MKKEKEEVLRLMAKFRSRLDILWRIATRICEGDFPPGQPLGSYRHYDTPLIPLIGIDIEKGKEMKKPIYEEAIKIAFETIMADFYKAEELIKSSL